MSKLETKYSQALDTIRRSICLANSDEEMILRETSLAEDFGMSRTPIRQILQRLAYEGLVETRSGVGNVVVPLLPEHRARDFLTHKGILQAALLFDLPDLTIGQHSEIVAAAAMADLFKDDDLNTLYDIRNRLHFIMSGLMPDPIISNAFSVSHWRTIRRHAGDFSANPTVAGDNLRTLVEQVTGYEAQNATDLFKRFIMAECPD